MKCEDCGKVGTHHKYQTFQYWYCEGCKQEVGGKKPPKEVSDDGTKAEAKGSVREIHYGGGMPFDFTIYDGNGNVLTPENLRGLWPSED